MFEMFYCCCWLELKVWYLWIKPYVIIQSCAMLVDTCTFVISYHYDEIVLSHNNVPGSIMHLDAEGKIKKPRSLKTPNFFFSWSRYFTAATHHLYSSIFQSFFCDFTLKRLMEISECLSESNSEPSSLVFRTQRSDFQNLVPKTRGVLISPAKAKKVHQVVCVSEQGLADKLYFLTQLKTNTQQHISCIFIYPSERYLENHFNITLRPYPNHGYILISFHIRCPFSVVSYCTTSIYVWMPFGSQ